MARAIEALQRLVAVTSVGDSDWGLGIQARAQALVSDGEEAERSYQEAVPRACLVKPGAMLRGGGLQALIRNGMATTFRRWIPRG